MKAGIHCFFITLALMSNVALLAPRAVHAQCSPPPSGIVAWWPGNGNALDIVGGNNATLVGGVTYTNGEVGLAFNLDGTSGYAVAPASASLNVGQSSGLTIEGWIDPASLTEQPIVEWNNGSSYPGAHLWISVPGVGNGPGCLYANVVDTSGANHYFASPAGLVVTNAFQHVAMTYDKNSGNAVLYYNGAAVAQQNLGVFTPQTGYNLYLGDRPGGATPVVSFGGLLDEISIYSRALSAGEITNIFAAGSAGKCGLSCVPPPSGVISWWPGEGNALDIVGGNNGTLVGGVTFTNGEVGQAFSFDGVSGYVDVPYSAAFNPTGPFSVECWVKATPVQNYSQVLIVDKSHGFTDGTGWGLQINVGGTADFFYGIGGPTGNAEYFPFVATINSVLDNQWHHLAGVWTGTQLQIYEDGVLQNESIKPHPRRTTSGMWRSAVRGAAALARGILTGRLTRSPITIQRFPPMKSPPFTLPAAPASAGH